MKAIELFKPEHIEAAVSLWHATPHVSASSADEPQRLTRFLERNDGCSFVAINGKQVIGTCLCGHDGRRGFIHHLAVAPEWRGKGIGSRLVDQSLEALGKQGIEKCHALVYRDNPYSKLFWEARGWQRRDNLFIFSQRC